eukprot:CAMPEP_0181202986 /NCGR_PEP_ID=MMETSP1096-20121128/19142_1 /TAXON_ID=156174 ORGANISM="Chrysochromulina ericina, Strain CCMP281" /NCGR_SAMPLE_ID=MMETSP1096 /ASSEMBLY_ACC=CAM_ASM_000453 /LENGTH=248 /DNA_ID=CAMNT_0023293551 /DNA_START=35 /DNA_END=782 /DNA_ORIENTATION=+
MTHSTVSYAQNTVHAQQGEANPASANGCRPSGNAPPSHRSSAELGLRLSLTLLAVGWVRTSWALRFAVGYETDELGLTPREAYSSLQLDAILGGWHPWPLDRCGTPRHPDGQHPDSHFRPSWSQGDSGAMDGMGCGWVQSPQSPHTASSLLSIERLGSDHATAVAGSGAGSGSPRPAAPSTQPSGSTAGDGCCSGARGSHRKLSESAKWAQEPRHGPRQKRMVTFAARDVTTRASHPAPSNSQHSYVG